MVDWYMPWFMIWRQKMGSSKDHFCNLQVIVTQRLQIFLWISSQNKNDFENILGYYSRGQVLSIHAKNQTSKISCYCPFNGILLESFYWREKHNDNFLLLCRPFSRRDSYWRLYGLWNILWIFMLHLAKERKGKQPHTFMGKSQYPGQLVIVSFDPSALQRILQVLVTDENILG